MAEPLIAQKSPYQFAVKAGRNYYWCACGLSKKQPLCDGSHASTDITPVLYEAKESKDVWFCGCKQTANKPMCDGTHGGL